jgi:hypothetical protein
VIPPSEDRAPTLELPQRPPLMRPAELIAIGTIVAVDQLTKFLVRSTIPLYAKRVMIPRLLELHARAKPAPRSACSRPADFP